MVVGTKLISHKYLGELPTLLPLFITRLEVLLVLFEENVNSIPSAFASSVHHGNLMSLFPDKSSE